MVSETESLIPEDHLVEVATFYSLPELLVFEALLTENGIIFHGSGEYHATVDPITLALGGLSVYVPHAQLTAKMALFDRQCYFESSDYRSRFFIRNPVKAMVALLCSIFLAIPVPIHRRFLHFRWNAKSEEHMLGWSGAGRMSSKPSRHIKLLPVRLVPQESFANTSPSSSPTSCPFLPRPC